MKLNFPQKNLQGQGGLSLLYATCMCQNLTHKLRTLSVKIVHSRNLYAQMPI